MKTLRNMCMQLLFGRFYLSLGGMFDIKKSK